MKDQGNRGSKESVSTQEAPLSDQSSSGMQASAEAHAHINHEIPIPILRPLWLHPVGQSVRIVRASPDGQYVAFATEEGAMKVLEPEKGDVLFEYPSRDSFFGASDLQFSPDGSALAMGLENGQLVLFSLSTHSVIYENLKLEETPENICWARDSKAFFFSLGKKIVRWSIEEKSVVESDILEEENTITDMSWLDGKMLGYTTYSHFKIVESQTGQLRQDFSWKGSLLSLEICPNKKYGVCGTQDRTLHIWNLSTKKDMEMRGFGSKIKKVSFREDGLAMAHGTANEVIIWDFSGSGPSGKRPQTLGPFETEVVEVLYQNSGKVLCSAGRDGVLLFWNPSESSQPIFISGIRDQEISNFEWAPDDSFLFVGFTSGYVALIPSSLIFKNLAL